MRSPPSFHSSSLPVFKPTSFRLGQRRSIPGAKLAPITQASARRSPASSSSRSSTTAARPRPARARTWSACSANPRQLGYGQLDVFALESRQMKAESRARPSCARTTCANACSPSRATRTSPTAASLPANAGRLRFILPPAGSGSAGTFQFLRAIDADGLGKAKSVTNAASDRGCHPRGAVAPTTP